MELLHFLWEQRTKLTPQVLIGIIGFSFLLCILLLFFCMPRYALLFDDLEAEDAEILIAQLEEAHLAYRIEKEGRAILVDAAKVHQTRLQLMQKELPISGRVGFELFDKSDFGISEFSQKIQYFRALQGELERTIVSLQAIKRARVHLLLAPRQDWQEAQESPRASVTLYLQQPLQENQVKSIQQLVAASVPKLRAERVIVLDQHGNALHTQKDQAFSQQFLQQASLEQTLQQKVMSLLSAIYGDKKVVVSVNVTLDCDILQKESTKPTASLLKEEKEEEHTDLEKKGKTPAVQDKKQEKHYVLGEEKERYIKSRGRIARLSIAVVLPKSTPINLLQAIEKLIQSAVGFSAKRGDTVTVANLLEEPILMKSQAIESIPRKEYHHKNFLFLILSLCALVGAIGRYWAFRKRRTYLLQTLQRELTSYEKL